jgi:hypothetical protein
VGAGIDVRVHAQRNRGANTQLGGDHLQALKLIGGLDVEAVHADFEGAAHVVTGLADAGENDLVGAATRGQYTFQLTTGNDVETGAETGQDIQYTEVGVGFDREADQMRHAGQRIGVGQILRFDVGARVDIGGRAEAVGDGGQRHTFREQLPATVVKSVHGDPLVNVVLVSLGWLLLRRLGLFGRVLVVIGQVQRAFLTTGRNQAGNRDERSKGRDQALHGEILENALIAPEYTGHPAACLCEGVPVRRGSCDAHHPCGSEPAREGVGKFNRLVA